MKSKLPWHAVRYISFTVDSDSLTNRQDFGIDEWRWEAFKTLTLSTSDISQEASYQVTNVISEYRIVKRYYRCNL